jgi:hypothetical protein
MVQTKYFRPERQLSAPSTIDNMILSFRILFSSTSRALRDRQTIQSLDFKIILKCIQLQGSRHQNQSQIRPSANQISDKNQRKICKLISFVNFIKNDMSYTGQIRITKQPTPQHTGGAEREPGGWSF